MGRAVLVPVDASSFAEHALPHALRIAHQSGAELILAMAHGIDDVRPPHPLIHTTPINEALDRDRAAAYLEDLAGRLEPARVPIRLALLRGRPSVELARFVEVEAVNLVVMTTHGRGGLERAWMGSTTDRMIRQCGAPILVIRPREETREAESSHEPKVSRVLVALDGSADSDAALRSALDLAVPDDASITLAHVLTWGAPPEAAFLPRAVHTTLDDAADTEARMRSHLDDVARSLVGRSGPVQRRLIAECDAPPAILSLAEEEDADLIVVGTRGHGGLRRLVMGSVADKVVRGTHRAVYVARCVRGGR